MFSCWNNWRNSIDENSVCHMTNPSSKINFMRWITFHLFCIRPNGRILLTHKDIVQLFFEKNVMAGYRSESIHLLSLHFILFMRKLPSPLTFFPSSIMRTNSKVKWNYFKLNEQFPMKFRSQLLGKSKWMSSKNASLTRWQHQTIDLHFSFVFFFYFSDFQVTTRTSLPPIHRRTPFICWPKSSASNRRKILHSHWPSISSQNIVMSKRRTCTLTNIHGNASATQMRTINRESTIMHLCSHQSRCAIATLFINVVSSNDQSFKHAHSHVNIFCPSIHIQSPDWDMKIED